MDGTGLIIREATEADRPVLERFMAALQDFEVGLSDIRTDGQAMAAGHIAYLLACVDRQEGFALIAEDGAAAVGFLIGMVETIEDGDLHIMKEHRRTGMVTDLYVAPEARGRGVARHLLSEAEARFAAAGLTGMEICFLDANDAARASYEKFGFKPYERLYRKPLK